MPRLSKARKPTADAGPAAAPAAPAPAACSSGDKAVDAPVRVQAKKRPVRSAAWKRDLERRVAARVAEEDGKAPKSPADREGEQPEEQPEEQEKQPEEPEKQPEQPEKQEKQPEQSEQPEQPEQQTMITLAEGDSPEGVLFEWPAYEDDQTFPWTLRISGTQATHALMVKHPHYIDKIALHMAHQIFVLAGVESTFDMQALLLGHLRKAIQMCLCMVSENMPMIHTQDKWSLQLQRVRFPRAGEPWVGVRTTMTIGE
jgi:hypothetical protein